MGYTGWKIFSYFFLDEKVGKKSSRKDAARPLFPRLSDIPPAEPQVDIDAQIDALSVIDIGIQDIFDCLQ